MFRLTQKLALIIAYDFKNMLSGWFALIVFTPFFISLAIMASMPKDLLRGAMTPISVAVISGGDSMVNMMIYSSLNTISLIENIERPRNQQIALDMLDSGEVSAVIKIPDGMIEALMYNNKVEIEVWSNITNPAMNTMLRDFADGVTKAITTAQSSIYAFYDAAPGYYESYAEFYEAYSGLAVNILAEVLQRSRFITIEESLYNYTAQLISVLTFVTGAVASALIAINSAYQFADGSYTRMRLSGVGYKSYVVTKLLETLTLAICVSGPAVVLGAFILQDGFSGFDIYKLLLCVILVAVIFFGISHCIALLCRNAHWTALAAFSVMLLLMFAGGAFYPLHFFGGIMQAIGIHTPASLNTMAVIWASGGLFPYEILFYAAGAIVIPFILSPVFSKKGALYV